MTSNTPDGAPLRILVVDDELLIRWSITEALTAAGHHVTEADSAATALHAVSTAPLPDVMLLDYRLPDSADLTLLARLRELAPRAAIIFMTAFGSADVVEGALKRGAYQVLSKPFDVQSLPALVREAYASRAT